MKFILFYLFYVLLLFNPINQCLIFIGIIIFQNIINYVYISQIDIPNKDYILLSYTQYLIKSHSNMNKLQQVRYAAAYTALAQKLDMHIKNFDSDPNTQIRWIWELIQNAKDAPNKFKQTKIKQQLDDYYFISKHNGDAFEIAQLHSVVAQYSTKKQKNSQQTKTTGKYGTGFITTYILSKIIQLQGILRVQIQNDSSDEDKNDPQEDSSQQSDLQDDQFQSMSKLMRRLQLQNLRNPKFKNHQKASRLIRNQLLNKFKSQKNNKLKYKKGSYIKKNRKNRDLQKRRNRLIFQKQFQKLMIEEELAYQEQIELLKSSLSKLTTNQSKQFPFKPKKQQNSVFKTETKKKHHKKSHTNFYYKKFSIPMDRSYIDRDEQLPKKIQKTQKRLTKIVLEAQYQSKNKPDFEVRDYYQSQRTPNSYDTIFRYKLVDKQKFQMIQKTIKNVRELIPYAFLFNDNLTYYEFIDVRKNAKDLSFSITKGNIEQIGPNICLFSYEINQHYDHKKKSFKSSSVGYFVSYFHKKRAIAAVPVQIQDDIIKISVVKNHLPKVFKDFPLIGCTDIKWNAVINSRQFYPNQKRSQLMLKSLDQTNKDKVNVNWRDLYQCFKGVKQIYLFLTQHCKYGRQNLLIFNSNNPYCLQNPQFRAFISKNILQIVNSKFVPTKVSADGQQITYVEPVKLCFIQIAYKKQQIYNKEQKNHFQLSKQANRIFRFLFGDQLVLNDGYYKDFYQVLRFNSQYRSFIQNKNQKKMVNFYSLNDCLRKMQTLSFKQFCILIKVNYIQKLHQIYGLLKKYNQFAYLSLSTTPCFDFKIFLNQNSEFKRLREDEMKFNDIPDCYEELAIHLKMNINEYIIHKEFMKYINQKNRNFYFDIPKLQQRICKHFQWNSVSQQPDKNSTNKQKTTIYGTNHFKDLIKLLITFKTLNNKTFQMVKKFTQFQNTQPFDFKKDKKKLQNFNNQVANRLLAKFVSGFCIIFNGLLKENNDLKKYCGTILSIKYYDEAIDFLKDLFKDKILGQSLGKLAIKLSWSGTFRHQPSLFKLNQNVSYPDKDDIDIYNINRIYRNGVRYVEGQLFGLQGHSNFQNIQNCLVHQLYPKESLNNIQTKNYSVIFMDVIKNFNKNYLTIQEQYQILAYVNKLNRQYKHGTHLDAAIIQKYQAWKNIIQKRLHLLVQLKYKNNELQNQKTKQFLYNLLQNKKQLKCAQLIYQNNGNKLFFQDLCNQLGLSDGQKKVQKKQQVKNIKK